MLLLKEIAIGLLVCISFFCYLKEYQQKDWLSEE
jgi:hypothetical protein